MVGYFVKMLWNIKRLKCSLRFERKNIILFKKPTTSPQIQFDIFYLQLTCGQIALAQMQFWFSHWREAKSFQMTRCLYFPPLELVCQAALLIMFWLSFCTPFKVGRESGCPICHLHPPANKGVGKHRFTEHLCAMDRGGAGTEQWAELTKKFLPSRSSPPSSAFYTREMEGSE